MPVKVVRDNAAEAFAAVDALTRKMVVVGIPADKASREGSPISNAAIGYLQETGVPEKNIPARPFLVPGVSSAEDKISGALRKGAEKVLDGGNPDDGLNGAGLIAQAAVKQKIVDGPFDPLSPITIMLRGMRKHDPNLKVTGKTVGEAAQRVADGKTNYGAKTTPLRDTESLFQHITYVIRDR